MTSLYHKIGELKNKELTKIYIALFPKHRQILKDFAAKVAATEQKKTTPAPPIEKEPKEFDETKKPEGISDEDWNLLVMHHRAERAKKNTASA